MSEQVTSVEHVFLYRRGQRIAGSLVLLKHHLVFTFHASLTSGKREIWICYPIIDRISKSRGQSWANLASGILSATTDGMITTKSLNSFDEYLTSHIKIECKDFTYYSFDFENEGTCTELFCRLSKLANAAKLKKQKREFYAFEYQPNLMEKSLQMHGWELYDSAGEYQRQGLLPETADRQSFWRVSELNYDFKICPSYPRALIVPSTVSDSVLQHAAKFRLKLRIPAVVYKHRFGENGNVIARCSQPLVGLNFQNRSPQDEKLVEEIFRSQEREHKARLGPLRNEQPQRNLIVDLRPITNAMAQHALGAGTENVENYKAKKKESNSLEGKMRATQHVDKIFCNIDNIHVMRDSLDKLVSILSNIDRYSHINNETSKPVYPALQQALSKTHWLHRLSLILQAVDRITKSVHLNNTNVLIHCSDGWDRTSQVSALLQLCLDPYYRSMKGFMVLIEKEWVSFGFKFASRADHGSCIGTNLSDCYDQQAEILPGLDDRSCSATPGVRSSSTPSASGTAASVTAFLLKAASHIKKKASAAASSSTEWEGDNLDGLTNSFYSGSNEKSPIFHQFLDCVYQILRQYPNQFEFNSRFLKRLFYHHYSCQYGTFLCDSLYEASEILRINERTISVWDYFLSRPNEFLNPTFCSNEEVVFFNFTEVKWWFELYGRSDEEMNGLSNSLEEKFAQLVVKLDEPSSDSSSTTMA